ncbi:MAG TPA: Appr-1-p processing protein [Synergistaceae bacterium]|jgi:O-acetyl-ADP-ribose deacetylase (regulator of RNase III)|nr:Appr-1-p processing protein [Synergistaceae bacterium]HCR38639.1 Appr-1-p processing protein [Synergistaceae bacterium]
MVSERTVGRTVIRLRKGDITAFEGEAIVNAANSSLWMGSGVAGAIKRLGGESIEREAMGKAPIEPGEAVVTDAGALKARYVIHAAVMGDDLATSEALIRAATQNSLYKCDELNIQSVAFPALGTGVGRFPVDKCAHAMIDEVFLYLQEETDTSLREIVFYLFGEETYQSFSRALEKVRGVMRNS